MTECTFHTKHNVSTQYKKTRNINSQQLITTHKLFLDLFNKLNTMHWESVGIIGNEYRVGEGEALGHA